MMPVAIKAVKAAIMAIRGVENTVNNARPMHTMPRLIGPVLKQPTFAWKATDKYKELCNFELDVKNTFITNNYNTNQR